MKLNKSKKEEKTKFDFIPLSVAAKMSGYTPEHLNLLSRKGILGAKKIGRNWHTTEEWLNEYLLTVSKTKGSGFLGKEKFDEKGSSGDLNIFEKRDSLGEENILESKAPLPVQDDSEENISSEVFLISENEVSKKQRPIWLQIFSGVAAMVIILPIIFSVSFFLRQKFSDDSKIDLADQIQSENEIINENDSKGIVRGEEDNAVGKSTTLASENFKVKQIVFGEIAIAATKKENIPLEISDIRSESFIENKKGEVKLLISWKTNKLAVSDISYSKNNGQNSRTLGEKSYGFNHSVMLTQLEPRTSYVYQVKCRDHWGNEIGSNYFVIYTASKPESVFDLISKAMNDVFGWALK